MRVTPIISILFSLSLSYLANPATVYASAKSDLRVMTFNVRYPNPDDGPNRWSLRAPMFMKTISQAQPDIIGTQEIFYQQGQDLVKALPIYQWFGVDRFGGHQNEHMGIFYRKDRLQLIKHGTFWLSEHPKKAGSMSWGVALPRYVNWAIFATKTQQPYQFLFLDSHFANRDVEDRLARLRSAQLILKQLPQLAQGRPVILTADLNSIDNDQPHRLLASQLVDAWASSPHSSGPKGTFHDFTGHAQARIDFIMTCGFKAQSVRVDDYHQGSHYPSDHFPVEAVLQPSTIYRENKINPRHCGLN